jgi:putative MFS transporter
MEADKKIFDEKTLNPRIIGRAVDQMPLTRPLLWVTVIGALGFLFDNMDNQFLGYALPGIAKEFNLGPETIGLIASAGMIGMATGSFLWGWIADKWGRRMAFSVTILIFSIFTGLLAASYSVGFFIGVRFISGTGLGGAVPVDSSLITEFSPARIRGRLNGALPIMFPIGMIFSSGCALLIIPAFGWRGLFLVGVLPALLTAFVRRKVPESPRWLANRGRFSECRKALHFIGLTDEGLERAGVELESEPAPPMLPRPRFFDLFSPEMRGRTIHTWMIWGLPLIGGWGMSLWMPTFFVKLYGIQLVKTLTYLFIISFVSLGGRLTAYFLVDRFGRKPFIILAFIFAGIATFAFGFIHTEAQLVVAVAFYCYFSEMGFTAITVYTPEVYPLHIRALGTSASMGVGRIGGAVAPYMIGLLMARGQVPWIWVVIGSGFIIPALATIWMGIETRGQNLEQLTKAAMEEAAKAR